MFKDLIELVIEMRKNLLKPEERRLLVTNNFDHNTKFVSGNKCQISDREAIFKKSGYKTKLRITGSMISRIINFRRSRKGRKCRKNACLCRNLSLSFGRFFLLSAIYIKWPFRRKALFCSLVSAQFHYFPVITLLQIIYAQICQQNS